MDPIARPAVSALKPVRQPPSEIFETVCRMLDEGNPAKRIDITWKQDQTSDHTMETIKLANAAAREWNLNFFVSFQAGTLQLTFIAPAVHQRDGTRHAS